MPVRQPDPRSRDPRAPDRRRTGPAHGFTLIELMVTVAIAGIFTAIAAPQMTSMFRGNRIVGEAASMVSDMQFARTEAVRRGQAVSMCPSSNGSSCLSTNTWQSGWLIFSDVASNGVFDSSTDAILRYRATFKGSDTFVAAPAKTVITFNREGFTSNLGSAAVTVKLHSADNVAAMSRCVRVDIGGRVTTQKAGESSCT